MEARRQADESTHGKIDDEIYVEEFAKDFFGSNQTDNDSSQSEEPEVTPLESRKELHKDDQAHNRTIYKKDQSKAKVEKRIILLDENQSNRKNKSLHSLNTLHPRDSGNSIVEQFLLLRDEFRSLSERLYDANMPKISKKLTQVLRERQKLMKLLLDMETRPSPKVSSGREEKRFEDETTRSRGVSKQGFEMPKKAKSVHWSDEHLGGSIIKDPTVYAPQPTVSSSALIQTTGLQRYQHANLSKPPPRYKMADRQTQTPSFRDLDLYYRNARTSRELEYINEILRAAAELRREACCMIWRAHYLEQLCDSDGLVKHVYHSTSNVPSLPRHSHLC